MKHETATPVGSDGRGEVHKSWDPDLERWVALKYLRRDDPVLVERLLREARAQARVDHPSVGRVYEVGSDGGRSGSPPFEQRRQGSPTLFVMTRASSPSV